MDYWKWKFNKSEKENYFCYNFSKRIITTRNCDYLFRRCGIYWIGIQEGIERGNLLLYDMLRNMKILVAREIGENRCTRRYLRWRMAQRHQGQRPSWRRNPRGRDLRTCWFLHAVSHRDFDLCLSIIITSARYVNLIWIIVHYGSKLRKGDPTFTWPSCVKKIQQSLYRQYFRRLSCNR